MGGGARVEEQGGTPAYVLVQLSSVRPPLGCPNPSVTMETPGCLSWPVNSFFWLANWRWAPERQRQTCNLGKSIRCVINRAKITKHYDIEIYLSSIAQYFPILPSCWSNMENQLYQYSSPRKVNAEFVKNVCIVTWVRKYNEIKPKPEGNPSGLALRISLGLRLYFIVYPSSCHNTDTICKDLSAHLNRTKLVRGVQSENNEGFLPFCDTFKKFSPGHEKRRKHLSTALVTGAPMDRPDGSHLRVGYSASPQVYALPMPIDMHVISLVS